VEPLTEAEKAEIYRFLGYPNYADGIATTIGLGYPGQVTQTLFTIRTNIDRLAPESVVFVREALCELRSIQRQQSDARGRMRAMRIGELQTNPLESAQLSVEWRRWQRRLADLFGTYPNPYAQEQSGGVGGINGTVIG